MKLGDLVRKQHTTYTGWAEDNDLGIGLVIETGVYTGRKDVKVMWQNGSIRTDKSRRLEVISEYR